MPQRLKTLDGRRILTLNPDPVNSKKTCHHHRATSQIVASTVTERLKRSPFCGRAVIFALAIALVAILQQGCERDRIPTGIVDHATRSMMEDDGYRFFYYTSARAASFEVTANLDNQVRVIYASPPTKDIVIAVLVGVDYSVGGIRIFCNGESLTRNYQAGYGGGLSFQDLAATKPPVLGLPFLSLRSADHKLSLLLNEK